MTPGAVMENVIKAFSKGDLQPLMGIIDDATVWKSASAAEGLFRFGGQYKKRAGVVEVTAQIATVYVFRRFDPKEIISQGEIAWGLFDVEVEHLPTRNLIKLEFALRWHVRDGKLLEHQAFFDTASLLEQQGNPARP